MAGHSRDDVKQRRRGEANQAHAAKLHQHALQRVQRAPFQMAIGVEDEVRAPVHRYWIERQTCRIFSAWGPRLLASLSCSGSAILMKLILSTSVTTLTPSFWSLASDLCSSAIACAGCFEPTSVAAACTQPFCSSVSEAHSLLLTQMTLLLASCSVIDSTGATS